MCSWLPSSGKSLFAPRSSSVTEMAKVWSPGIWRRLIKVLDSEVFPSHKALQERCQNSWMSLNKREGLETLYTREWKWSSCVCVPLPCQLLWIFVRWAAYPLSKVISFPSQVMVDQIFLLGISHPRQAGQVLRRGSWRGSVKTLRHYLLMHLSPSLDPYMAESLFYFTESRQYSLLSLCGQPSMTKGGSKILNKFLQK